MFHDYGQHSTLFLKLEQMTKITNTFKRESYVYWTVHHLYSCVKRKNQLDATYFII